jgi:CBS domain-containing protein
MVENRVRRLAVMRSGELVGVIREQDLFFEMEEILRD